MKLKSNSKESNQVEKEKNRKESKKATEQKLNQIEKEKIQKNAQL